MEVQHSAKHVFLVHLDDGCQDFADVKPVPATYGSYSYEYVQVLIFVEAGKKADVELKFAQHPLVTILETKTTAGDAVSQLISLESATHFRSKYGGHGYSSCDSERKYYFVAGSESKFAEAAAFLKEKYERVQIECIDGSERRLSDCLSKVSCKFCKLLFNSVYDANYHKYGSGSGSTPLTCKHCKKEVACTSERDAKEHSENWRFPSCAESGCGTRSCKDSLPETCPQSHPKCAHCDKRFLNDAKLREHLDLGHFENYINQAAAPAAADAMVRAIMTAVNQACASQRATAEYGGSQRKHTGVCGYSDVDIFVNTHYNVDDNKRRCIANAVKRTLKADEIVVLQMQYKPVAVAFDCQWQGRELSFDLVFGSATWTLVPPTAPSQARFYNRPELQRAVRALKLLSKEFQERFPKTGGLSLENLVVEVSEGSEGVKDGSGFQIFAECLRAIASDKLLKYIGKKNRAAWKKGAAEIVVFIASKTSLGDEELDAIFKRK